MPTPRHHGGAQIQSIHLVSPGFRGLNTAQQGAILGPEWATKLTNVVYDDRGRPESRNGFVSGTTTVYDGTEKLIHRIFEYYKADGTSELISSTDDNILSGIVDLSDTTASIDGTLTISDGNIKFVNFNDSCFAFGIGTAGIPAKYTGSGSFADITVSSGTAPSGGVGTAAFGRLWGVDSDGKTLRYSALLDETKWDAANGGGSVDFGRAWPDGQDEIIAVEELGGELIVFGRKAIIRISDQVPTDLGLDPTQMYIVDTIAGVGALSQFGITKVGGDLWFVSDGGIRSIKREVVSQSASVLHPSDNIAPDIAEAIASQSTLDDMTLEYFPRDDMVLAVFPAIGETFVFDTMQPLEDGTHRASIWTVDLQTVAYKRDDRTLRASLATEGGGSTTGEIYNYSGYDDDGQSYIVQYESGWLDLGAQAADFLKFPKKMGSVVFAAATTNVEHTIYYDFNESGLALGSVSLANVQTAAQYNISEYTDGGGSGIGYVDPNDTSLGESEYSGTTLSLQTLSVPGKGSGQYIKVGLTADNGTGEFAIQQVNLYAKIGRIAT